jgi:hypothetical protein
VSIHLFELILMVVFVSSHPLDGHRTIRRVVRKVPAIAYWLTMAAIWLFAIAVSQDRPSKFIYFDF